MNNSAQSKGFLTGGSVVKKKKKICLPLQEMQVQLLGMGRSPGEGKGNPLQDSCLENPMDRGALWALVHEVADNQA